jgi:hypothetical protein
MGFIAEPLGFPDRILYMLLLALEPTSALDRTSHQTESRLSWRGGCAITPGTSL